MLVSFTQTYADNRKSLYKMYAKDSVLIDFKNQFDLNIHSFHNCSKDTIHFYKKHNYVKNSEYWEFMGIPYSETIKTLRDRLFEMGATHFFWSQDDTFAQSNEIYHDGLLDYIKTQERDFLIRLGYDINMIKRISPYPIEINKKLNLYQTNSFYCVKSDCSSMCDHPYIASIDVMEKIWLDEYLDQYTNVWKLEKRMLMNRFSKEYLEMLLPDKILFRNHNLIGKNKRFRLSEINNLKQRGIYART